MKYEEYGCFDIDEQQKIDNEVYENKFKIKRKIKEKKGIGKLKPIPLSQLMDQWKPREWIVDLFGAKGSCVLLAADKGSGKTTFIYRMAEALEYQKMFMGELKTKKSNSCLTLKNIRALMFRYKTGTIFLKKYQRTLDFATRNTLS